MNATHLIEPSEDILLTPIRIWIEAVQFRLLVTPAEQALASFELLRHRDQQLVRALLAFGCRADLHSKYFSCARGVGLLNQADRGCSGGKLSNRADQPVGSFS